MEFNKKRESNNYPYGGLLVFIIFMIGFFLLRAGESSNYHLLFGLFLIYIVGLIDDYKDLSVKSKLFLQFAAVLYLVIFGIRVNYVTNPFEGFIYFEELSFPVTILWILSMINLVNLLDALKGLASGTAIISSLFIMIIAWDMGRFLTVVFAAMLLIGLVIIKLLHRRYGSWQLGNSGSMFTGAVLALISILGAVKSITFISLFLPVILLGIPIINGIIAFYQIIFKKDFKLNQLRTRMLHHILLESGMSEEQSRHILYIISFVFGLAAFLLTKITTTQSFMIIIIIFFGLLVYFRELRHNTAKKSRLTNVKLLKDIQLSLYQIRDKLQYKLANGELSIVKQEMQDLEDILTKKLPNYFTDIEDISYSIENNNSIEKQLDDMLHLLENVFDYYYPEFDNLNYILKDYESELKDTIDKLDEIYLKLK
ncbi:UDP-N-acetylmuramyl pentapeptide phosphotransferase/UDP-N-acetylglucosamine-1-phosphate transferase [Halanaerobium sp. DL-01]|uniref:MraY family glycosyltransferase n=1 Tax=Halanaerobium sp. DL-01 TaxID=1653064 RepID=UPI000DF2F8EA|nr:MraY family glycosyltransferase [Halanaerobium sp. DL-01]RCW78355.1 UDP-N-acetylmuramyl pentapeptide phosphotransferase/UDP-N-acetylglucosamine-1-phosphate transferase [Halanaerobium sp. DL-01]